MEISSSSWLQTSSNALKVNKSDTLSATKSNTEGLRIASTTYSSITIEIQYSIHSDSFIKEPQSFDKFLSSIGYEQKPIASLSQDEAKALVSEDGFFGVEQTAKRLFEFVINGANGDIDKLRAGRAGIIEGFKEAERLWGKKLPEISYDTLDRALEQIDNSITDMGYSLIDEAI